MKRLITVTALAATLLTAGGVAAAERTVTLQVDNMTCPTCPYMVKRSLTRVPGVEKAEVSFRERTAVVTFDDAQTDVETLTAATANVGFPSRLMEQGYE